MQIRPTNVYLNYNKTEGVCAKVVRRGAPDGTAEAAILPTPEVVITGRQRFPSRLGASPVSPRRQTTCYAVKGLDTRSAFPANPASQKCSLSENRCREMRRVFSLFSRRVFLGAALPGQTADDAVWKSCDCRKRAEIHQANRNRLLPSWIIAKIDELHRAETKSRGLIFSPQIASIARSIWPPAEKKFGRESAVTLDGRSESFVTTANQSETKRRIPKFGR